MPDKVDLLQELFECSGWDDVDFCVNQFYDATFKRDFGAFKQGTKVNCLVVDFIHGTLEALNNEGKVEQRVNFTYLPQ